MSLKAKFMWPILMLPICIVLGGASSCDEYFGTVDEPEAAPTYSPLPLHSVAPSPTPVPSDVAASPTPGATGV